MVRLKQFIFDDLKLTFITASIKALAFLESNNFFDKLKSVRLLALARIDK